MMGSDFKSRRICIKSIRAVLFIAFACPLFASFVALFGALDLDRRASARCVGGVISEINLEVVGFLTGVGKIRQTKQ